MQTLPGQGSKRAAARSILWWPSLFEARGSMRRSMQWFRDLVATVLAQPDEVMLEIGTGGELLVANVPVVALGSRFASRLPLRAARIAAALVFLALGVWAALRGIGM